jgi:transcriptional regulator with XRE-family HTH domain
MPLNMEKNKNIQNFLKQVSTKDSGWLKEAQWEEENEYWLEMSFRIAVRIGLILRANKKADVYPKNQVELAEAMGCTPQYVSKLLKGQENMQIETICKIGRILNTKLIEVPTIEVKQKQQISRSNFFYGQRNMLLSSPLKSESGKAVEQVDVQKVKQDDSAYALAA